jgi:hypothetical protein
MIGLDAFNVSMIRALAYPTLASGSLARPDAGGGALRDRFTPNPPVIFGCLTGSTGSIVACRFQLSLTLSVGSGLNSYM